MRRFDRFGRLQDRVGEMQVQLDRVEARSALQQTDWSEMLDRLTKAYQRVEKANQRADRRDPPLEPELPIEEPSDPYARKVLEIRRQGGAVP